MKKVLLVLMMLVTSLTFAQETKKEVTKSLEETIQPYVEKLLDGAEKGITWTTEQIPEVIYADNTLLRLNQFQIHKVAPGTQLGLRTFIKVSFSKDKYDLKGNAKNHLLDYDWRMRDRGEERNIPQKIN